MNAGLAAQAANTSRCFRLEGTVQGIGLRPWLARRAHALSLSGSASNHASGVDLLLQGQDSAIKQVLYELNNKPPGGLLLRRLTELDCPTASPAPGFSITWDESSDAGESRTTGLLPDLAACPECRRDIFDPESRHFRHAHCSCSHCGPRYSLMHQPGWHRQNTALREFPACKACVEESGQLQNRRFAAEGISCHHCAPAPRIERLDGRAFSIEQFTHLDPVDAAASLIQQGHIVAIQGSGGFHLACDASRKDVVERLRQRKQRPHKPFAVMARDADVIRRYAHLDAGSLSLLQSPAAPIVLIAAIHESLPDSVAPGLSTFGFMLPATTLQTLLFRRLNRPAVMTSANRSGHPLCQDRESVGQHLQGIADWVLWHTLPIVNPADDSVQQFCNGSAAVLRYGRGLAPADIALPAGFETLPAVLAAGSSLKNSVCVMAGGVANLSPQTGDLDSIAMQLRMRGNLTTLLRLKSCQPNLIAADLHPDCVARRTLCEIFADARLETVPHHHAHAAACMIDNGRPLQAPPLLAIVLDGLGMGGDGEWLGGEFLLAGYRESETLARLQTTPLPGGDLAAKEPWRNTWAQLITAKPIAQWQRQYPELPLLKRLAHKPLNTLEAALRSDINCPTASSTGRLFDAVSWALNLAPDHISYEAQAALTLEQAANQGSNTDAYDFPLNTDSDITVIDCRNLWPALLADLDRGRDVREIALAFHRGLAQSLAALAETLFLQRDDWQRRELLLSGGVFQNALLQALSKTALEALGFQVYCHRQLPSNDGALAVGQAAIAAARSGEMC